MAFAPRIATDQDTAKIDALLIRSYPRLLKPDYTPSMLLAALPIISRVQPGLVTCGTYYVVEDGRDILGAGGWTVAAPGTGEIIRGVAHIRHVVTDDRATRRGIGRALMDHIATQARAAGMRRLQCMSTLTAVPFYTAMGFRSLKDVTVPLGDSIDFPAVAMEHQLQRNPWPAKGAGGAFIQSE